MRTISILAAAALMVGAALPAAAQEAPSVALILDASGSMNARLVNGQSRIEAAKAAVAEFTAGLAPMTRLAYRVYGHQSPREAKNCDDIELIADFAPIGENRAAILARTETIRAQGYTPITQVIEMAAREIAAEPGRRAVVLVSDGKETCAGDPCAAARALAEADAGLVIHTIGYAADEATRFQLQCIAEVARGTYSDAGNAAELAASLGAAVAAPPSPEPAPEPATSTTTMTLTIAQPKPGRLEIRNADPGEGHRVTDAASGTEVAALSAFSASVEIPAGIYNVSFGPTLWKSVTIAEGETTVLDPGVIAVLSASGAGHSVVDWETGVEVGQISSFKSQLTVLPSTFSVAFGGVWWTEIEVGAGERRELNPAVIAVNGAQASGHAVFADDGTLVATISNVASVLPVPPGKYTIEVGGQRHPLDLAEGQRMEINLQ